MNVVRCALVALFVITACDTKASDKPTAAGKTWTFDDRALAGSGPLLDPEVEKSWTYESDSDARLRVRITVRFAHVEHPWNGNPKASLAVARSAKVEILDNPRGLEVRVEVEPKGYFDPKTPSSDLPATELARAVHLEVSWEGKYRAGCKSTEGRTVVGLRLGGDQRFHSVPRGKLTSL